MKLLISAILWPWYVGLLDMHCWLFINQQSTNVEWLGTKGMLMTFYPLIMSGFGVLVYAINKEFK